MAFPKAPPDRFGVPTTGWMCGECCTPHSSFTKAEKCCRARLMGFPLFDLSDPKDRAIALECVGELKKT